MGRNPPAQDLLRTTGNRVEKQLVEQKRPLPPWFYRVATLAVVSGEKEVDPEDFDEDLSELDEKESRFCSAECECECDCDVSDCDCDFECECEDDGNSEQSFEGSDAEYYYELKDE